MAGAALTVLGAVVLAASGTEFVPRLSEGDIVIGVVRPAGTDLAESTRINGVMERLLLANFPDEIAHLWSRNGAPEVATRRGGVQATDLFVGLAPAEPMAQGPHSGRLVGLMRQTVRWPSRADHLVHTAHRTANERNDLGVRSDVALKLFGDDSTRLVGKAAELEKVLAGVPGCVDVATEQIRGSPRCGSKSTRTKLLATGLPAERVLEVVEALGSKPLWAKWWTGSTAFRSIRAAPAAQCAGPECSREWEGMLLLTPAGESMPLGPRCHDRKSERTER